MKNPIIYLTVASAFALASRFNDTGKIYKLKPKKDWLKREKPKHGKKKNK